MDDRSEEQLATDFLYGNVDKPTKVEPPRIRGVRLDRLIGEGAFGVVWQGEQFEPVLRPVAVKILRIGAMGSNAQRRFEAEKLALARLEHPHIAHILDAGTTAEGSPYLVMDYIDGISFDLWCHRQRDDVASRVRMCILVCRAIGYAHRQGILHRDLKPANVLVRSIASGVSEAATDEPRIIDFGVAKLVGDDALRTRTLQGPTAATPLYMSPEIAAGASEIDGRVDVWSLGVMLFEALVGSRPFSSSRSGIAATFDLQKQITEGSALRPSDALPPNAPRALRAALEDDLDWIVLRALERSPARRYLTPDELADDLVRWIEGVPVIARPSSGLYRLRKFARRNRAAFTTGIACATAIGLAAGVLVVGTLQSRRDATRWREIAAFNERMLTAIDPAVAQGLDPTLMRMVLEESEAELSRSTRDVAVEAEIRMSLGNAYAATGDSERALQQYGRVRKLRLDAGVDPESPPLRAVANAIGRVLVEAGRLDEAGPELDAATSARDTIAAQARHNRASLSRARGDLARAEAELRAALLLKRELRVPDLSVLDTEQELALVIAEQGRYADAEPIARSVLSAKLAVLGNLHPDSLRAANNLAEVLLAQEATAEASALLEETVRGCDSVLGSAHPDTLAARNNLAGVLRERGNLEAAASLYTANRVAFLESRGSDDPRSILAGTNLAHCLSLIGRDDEAAQLFREVQIEALKVLGPTHRYTLANDANYATHLVNTQREAEAVVLLDRTVPLLERELSPNHPQSRAARLTLAAARLSMGQPEAALEALGDIEAMTMTESQRQGAIGQRTLETAAVAAEAVGNAELAKRLRARLESPPHPAGARND